MQRGWLLAGPGPPGRGAGPQPSLIAFPNSVAALVSGRARPVGHQRPYWCRSWAQRGTGAREVPTADPRTSTHPPSPSLSVTPSHHHHHYTHTLTTPHPLTHSVH